MATKLKNLKVSKVDFVDEGANQKAYINLYKRKEPEEEPQESLFKRFVNWLIGEGMDDAQIGEEIQKAAASFNEQLAIRNSEEVEGEMYNIMYALKSSLYSIMVDPEVDAASKPGKMTESVNQFAEAMQEYIPEWSMGHTAVAKSADDDMLGKMEAEYRKLGEMIEKLKPAVNDNDQGEPEDGDDVDPPDKGSKKKGETEDMKVDKSKMSPEMQAAYDELVAKGVLVPGEGEEGGAGDPVTKAPEMHEPEGVEKKNTLDPEIEELKKSMQAEIDSLRKQRETAENDALMAVAKKYEVLGRKPEELVKKLKALKSVSEDLYNSEIAALDELAKSMEQSVFGEIGKSREGRGESAITKAKALASELRKSNPALSEAQALDQVLLTNDELRRELDQ